MPLQVYILMKMLFIVKIVLYKVVQQKESTIKSVNKLHDVYRIQENDVLTSVLFTCQTQKFFIKKSFLINFAIE